MRKTSRVRNHIKTTGLCLGVVAAAGAAQASPQAGASTNSPAATGTNAPPTSSSGTVLGGAAGKGFWHRLDDAFREQMGQPAVSPPDTNAPPSPRRVMESPFAAPPYPTAEWQIGGTSIIGDQNLTPDYPLMEALYLGPHGAAWENAYRIKFYGWEDFSGNASTSDKGASSANIPNVALNPNIAPNAGPSANANFPLVYDLRPNRLEQNQFVLYAERNVDMAQVDHVDWGFRVSGVYGLDYRYMISLGLFDHQLLRNNAYYGFDMPMVYTETYFPKIAQGLNIRVGRIISEADIEAQLAPNNLMSSHSLLYGFDPYTQEGIFGTLKLNKNWTLQAGLADGGDVAIWAKDPAASIVPSGGGVQMTGTVMFQYTSDNNKFSFYGGANQFNNAMWGYNNLQQYVGTFSYKFNENIWTSWETWYMFQEHAPSPAQDAAYIAKYGALPPVNSFYPTKGGYAPEYASLNYTMFKLAPATFLSVRNEVFNDLVGERTGVATVYSEHSVGITYWPNKLITIRPELRFDHAYAQRAFDNYTRHNQFTAQMDVIFHF